MTLKNDLILINDCLKSSCVKTQQIVSNLRNLLLFTLIISFIIVISTLQMNRILENEFVYDSNVKVKNDLLTLDEFKEKNRSK